MCRELYGQDDMERPELFSHMFQIVVMGDGKTEEEEWFDDFAMYRLFCNHTLREAERLASNAIMIRDACLKRGVEHNQVFRLDPETGEARSICHPGRACDTCSSESTVGIVLASLILIVLLLLLMTSVWELLRNTHIDRHHTV